MSRLQAELQRLYVPLQEADGRVRAPVLELARPADWAALGRVWQGVQADLQLPAPAIAISGTDGYQLWFSLAEPVATTDAIAFLDGLRRRYLGDIATERVASHPGTARTWTPPPVPVAPGRWSAFVTADLAALFADEPWLDLEPTADAQAELLARHEGIAPDAFARALAQLRPTGTAPAEANAMPARPKPAAGEADPRRFLLGVMNDPGVDLRLRIEAAKALLPHVDTPRAP